jgi:hypothetical protein
MPPKEKPTCPVCMTHFTAVIRQPIQCSFCPHAACRQCTSHFLLTTQNDSHCMECKREWNREFIDTHLTQTFRKGPLKLHRRRVLMDRERGRLPAMQVFVEAQIIINRNSERIAQLRVERKRLKVQRNQIQAVAAAISFDELSRQLEPIHKQLAEKKTLIRQLDRELWTARGLFTGQEKPEAREFIMKCPAEECRGFLSSAWKCGTCEKFFCSDCHAQKAGQRDENHVCNEDAKATAAMIRKETKPCPKCGIRISKIDGCFAKDTPILKWDGHYSNAQDIKVGDVLVGDDGTPRVVEELCSGGDEMFEVTQGKGMTYTVNSKHKLALKFSGEKSIHWSESEKAWKVRWFDRKEHCMKSKMSRMDETVTKEEAYTVLNDFCQTLRFDEVIEMTVDDYMVLPESIKKHLMGFKSSGINWPNKEVPLDPYLMGLWVGDGINDAMSFSINPEADPEIIQYLLKWCEENQAELIHDEAYRFRIRRREAALGRLAIGRGTSSSECKGCKDKKCGFCDLPETPYTDEVEVGLRHPLKEQLAKYDLPRKSKYIPTDYLVNSREVRLQVLAGLIDSDGYVGNDGKRIQIPQANHNVGKQIEFLARSLGFAVHVDIVKKTQIPFPNNVPKDYGEQYRVNISSEHLSEIPTKLARKRCVDSNSTKDELRTGITVKSVGQGAYYGWTVSGLNRRFLLADFTVARNCDQMWCTGCHTTFSWNSGQILLNTVVHNPHYYEYLRRTNGGAIPREAGDVPCGGLPNAYLFNRVVATIPHIDAGVRNTLYGIHRSLSDVLYARLPQFPLRAPANGNRDLDIAYLMQKITEEEWGTKLEQTETRFERKKEVGLILQTFVHIGSEKLTQLQNQTNPREQTKLAGLIVKEMEEVRTYVNKSLLAKGVQMGMVVPQFDQYYMYRWATREQIREEKNKKGAPSTEDVDDQEEIEGPVEDKPVENVIVQPAVALAPAPVPVAKDPASEFVTIEIDGEMIEMTRKQAMEVLNVRA